MDLLTVFGVLLGLAAIAVGFSLEGGHFTALLQPQALVIVLGGTLAVMQFGPLNQWINNFWGGAVSASAGCLFFGSLPRLKWMPCLRCTVTVFASDEISGALEAMSGVASAC